MSLSRERTGMISQTLLTSLVELAVVGNDTQHE